jgi:hypothetical protein
MISLGTLDLDQLDRQGLLTVDSGIAAKPDR